MRNTIAIVCAFSLAASASLLACTSDDTVDATDAGHTKDASYDVTIPLGDASIPPEASSGDDASDAGGDQIAPLLSGALLVTYTYDNYQKTEYAAFDLASSTAAGHMTLPDFAFGTNVFGGQHEWVLDQADDVVHEMSKSDFATEIASWSVAEPKSNDAGAGYGNPWTVVEVGSKAYVTLFNRNVIAVLDTSQSPDGGAPASTIDLSGLVQANDTDGYVDQTYAVYDDSTKRLYVLLANIDIHSVDPQGFFQICVDTKSTVIAIDTTNDTLVNLGDAGFGGGIPLKGKGIQGVTFDPANHRLLVLTDGCNEPSDGGPDAGVGGMTGRAIEEVNLASGTTQIRVDANAKPFPGQIAFVNDHRVIVSFGGVTYAYDPTTTSLGAIFPAAPDSFALDPTNGSIVGPRGVYLADGGYGGIEVIAVDTNDGGVTTLTASPVTTPDPLGYFSGVDYRSGVQPSPPPP